MVEKSEKNIIDNRYFPYFVHFAVIIKKNEKEPSKTLSEGSFFVDFLGSEQPVNQSVCQEEEGDKEHGDHPRYNGNLFDFSRADFNDHAGDKSYPDSEGYRGAERHDCYR